MLYSSAVLEMNQSQPCKSHHKPCYCVARCYGTFAKALHCRTFWRQKKSQEGQAIHIVTTAFRGHSADAHTVRPRNFQETQNISLASLEPKDIRSFYALIIETNMNPEKMQIEVKIASEEPKNIILI